MKRIFAIALCIVMALSVIACGEKAPAEKDYKLGMGVVVSMDSSADKNAQVDATVATVVLDADGKIVLCRIDVAQNKMDVTDGAVNTDLTFKTKMEKGDEYGMAGKVDNDKNGVMKEWYEQTKAFEAYVVGKTVAEVEAIKTQEVNNHQIAVDQALLDAGCSMQITEFRDAVVKACKDTKGQSFKAVEGTFTLGVAAKTNVDSATKAATAEADGLVCMYTDFAASAVVDGKIVASINDAIQPKITIDAEGKIVEKTFKATKRELGSEYGMEGKVDNDGNGVMLEWDAQSDAFSKFVVGKTAAEVAALQTQEKGNHMIAVDQALLDAGCSMQITGIMAVVAQSVNNAR